jgi:bacteriocin-like protein
MIDSTFFKELTSDELDRVVGGADPLETFKAELQNLQALTTALTEVLKNLGGALQTVARGK